MSTINTEADELVQVQGDIGELGYIDEGLFAIFETVGPTLLTCGRAYTPQIYACPTD
jgi:hypothetical protein